MKLTNTPEQRLALARAILTLQSVGALGDDLYLLAMTTEERRGWGGRDKRTRSEYMAEEVHKLLRPFDLAARELSDVFNIDYQERATLSALLALADQVAASGQDLTPKVGGFER